MRSGSGSDAEPGEQGRGSREARRAWWPGAAVGVDLLRAMKGALGSGQGPVSQPWEVVAEADACDRL